MDPRLLKYYNQELQHVREMGSEFAAEYPKIAGRLGMDGIECADPYVERLLEGFAFMSARVQLKLDAEYPSFTQHLFELIYPHYLAPMPSMAVVELFPDLTEGGLVGGVEVERGSIMRTAPAKGEQTACTYVTAQSHTLWPVELTEARYFSGASTLANIGVTELRGVKAGIRLSLRTTAGVAFDELSLDDLVLYLRGADALPHQIYEQLLANGIGAIVRPKGGKAPWTERLPKSSIHPVGFSNDEAMLPLTRQSFHGYRLLQEYFAFPDRFLFVKFAGLQKAVSRCSGTELELIVLLDRPVSGLESLVDSNCFSLNCVPVVNLFEKRADRIHIDEGSPSYHVLADRTRPMDYEVYAVKDVRGHGSDAEDEVEFRPFYLSRDLGVQHERMAYYTAAREPRLLSSKQRKVGARSSYIGSEIFLSIVDSDSPPFSRELKQLSLNLTCTNRDLPLQLSLGKGKSDMTLESGVPVDMIKCVAGPTRPRPPLGGDGSAWRLVSHLSLNYMSLTDSVDINAGENAAVALRELLSLYAPENDLGTQRQIEGIKSISSKPITRRLPTTGPISFGRGLEITLECEDGAYEGAGVFMLGCVLEEFFARYVSMNSFTETVLRTLDRGEVARWPARIGQRPRL
jgi:type VI secretion system protein ImpG